MRKLTKILSCFLLFVLVGTFFASCSLFPEKSTVIIDDEEEEEEFEPESTLDMSESQIAINYIYHASDRTINYIAERYINSFVPYADGLYWSNGEYIFELEPDPAYFDSNGNPDGKHYFYNDSDDVVCVWWDNDGVHCNSQIYSYNNDDYTITLTPAYDVGQISLGHNYLMVDINGLVVDLEKKFPAYLMSHILTNGRDANGYSSFEEAASAFEQKYADAKNNISDFEAKYSETSNEFLERVKNINKNGIAKYVVAGGSFANSYLWKENLVFQNTGLLNPQNWGAIVARFWNWNS